MSVGLDSARCQTFLYPEKDALDMAQALNDFERLPGKSGNYAQIEVELLRGRQAMAANLTGALERLKTSAKPQDSVIVYLSGWATPQSETSPYTFLTYRESSQDAECNMNAPQPGLPMENFQKVFGSLEVDHFMLITYTVSLGFVNTLKLPTDSFALGIHEATEDEHGDGHRGHDVGNHQARQRVEKAQSFEQDIEGDHARLGRNRHPQHKEPEDEPSFPARDPRYTVGRQATEEQGEDN